MTAAGAAAPFAPADVGVVIIGRNEGERLVRCFDALPAGVAAVVYVDSASTDGSVAEARRRGIEVVELDLSLRFTAARARNAGLERLLALRPAVRLVQFIDGDSALRPGWLEAALRAMDERPATAVLCGRLRELDRDASIYKKLLDLEWDGPVGEIPASGGIALMRVAPVRQAGGFDPSLVAGEEPDLCARLREKGHKVERIAAEMALHDGAVSRFSQWWRRAVRSGYGYADMAARHPDQAREVRSIIAWGMWLPVTALGTALFTHGWGLALLAAYPLQWARITMKRLPRRDGLAGAYAAACVLGRIAEARGLVRWTMERLRGTRAEGPAAPSGRLET